MSLNKGQESAHNGVQAKLAAKARRTTENEERIQRRLYPDEDDIVRDQEALQKYQDEVLQYKMKSNAVENHHSYSNFGSPSMEHPWAMDAADPVGSAQV